MLTGWATRPLVEDVAGLSSARVLEKIRFEAQASVETIFHEREFAAQERPLKRAQARLEKLQHRHTNVDKKVDRFKKLKSRLNVVYVSWREGIAAKFPNSNSALKQRMSTLVQHQHLNNFV